MDQDRGHSAGNSGDGDADKAGARAESGAATGSHDNTGYPSGNSDVASGTDTPMNERVGKAADPAPAAGGRGETTEDTPADGDSGAGPGGGRAR